MDTTFWSFPGTISTSTAEVPSMPTVKFGGTIPTGSPLCLPIQIDHLTTQQTVATAGGSSTAFARPVWATPRTFSSKISQKSVLPSDGCDIYRSSYVTIQDSTIHNDDDCVSFKPTRWSKTSTPTALSGISVGSLGQYAGETDIVANIYVKNLSMNHAQNGARIKAFGGSRPQAEALDMSG
ncbi:pectin lyase fold/virulence factor [Lanmaoa asiatica]|nr:pectin lyase fold/virulence factor [Lanmaoa asiatica]